MQELIQCILISTGKEQENHFNNLKRSCNFLDKQDLATCHGHTLTTAPCSRQSCPKIPATCEITTPMPAPEPEFAAALDTYMKQRFTMPQQEASQKEGGTTMNWKNTAYFDVTDKGKLTWQEVYKNHEISIATEDNGRNPGIKVFQANNGEIQKPEDNPIDLTPCFKEMDAGNEIPLSMESLYSVFKAIDAWERNNRLQNQNAKEGL